MLTVPINKMVNNWGKLVIEMWLSEMDYMYSDTDSIKLTNDDKHKAYFGGFTHTDNTRKVVI